jgi:hypothetical protein
MEASQAGLAAGGNGQGDGGQGESQGPDVAALAQQLEAQGGTLEQMREFLVAQPWQQQPEPSQQEQEPTFHDDLDLSFLDPGDPTFDPQQVAERLSGLIDQVTDQKVNQAIQQHVDPLRQENVDARREREALALATEFPELEDNAVAGEVVGAARQIAEAYGQPELAAEPWFWRMTYMGGRQR